MPVCTGILGGGHHPRCTRNVPEGAARCPQHAAVHNRHVAAGGEPVAGNCLVWMTTGHWCTRPAAAGEIKCQWHIDLHARNHVDQEAQFLNAFLQHVPRPHWHEVARAIQNAHGLSLDQRRRVAFHYQLEMDPNVRPEEFTAYYMWAMNEARGFHNPEPVGPAPVGIQPVPPAPARVPAVRGPPTLAEIAADNQSVHTTAVSEQTNIGLQKLLNTPIPANQRTLETFAFLWLRMENATWGEVANTVDDMSVWYAKKMCRKPNDKLYQKTLDGLLAYILAIPSTDTKAELVARTYEECLDAKNMCCEGHITRLCNVLVGFDPDFASPVSKGEILQNKIAAISAMDVPATEKVKQAYQVFRDLDVPVGEWEAWIEALSD
jgi:hypothetical protein